MSQAETQQEQEVERHNAVWRWIHIFEILGLDRAELLYPQLGLNPEHAAAWRVVARNFLQQCYAWTDQTGSRDGWSTEQGEMWVRDALTQATDAVGISAAQALYAWGMGTFVEGEESPDYSFIWSNLLWNLIAAQGDQTALSELPAEKHAALEAATRRVLEPPENELIEVVEAEQASVWDTEIYRRYREWMQDEDALVSPLDWAQATIRYRRMRDLWATLQRTFTAADFQSLLTWARAAAAGSGLQAEEIALPPW